MNNVYKLVAPIMENLEQVAGKIETALSSINEALNNLADLPDAVANINTELTTIKNRLDALEAINCLLQINMKKNENDRP